MWPERKEDTEQLYADTRTLLENFKPSEVSAYVTSTGSDQNSQSAIYAIINEGNEMAGKIQFLFGVYTLYIYYLHHIIQSYNCIHMSESVHACQISYFRKHFQLSLQNSACMVLFLSRTTDLENIYLQLVPGACQRLQSFA